MQGGMEKKIEHHILVLFEKFPKKNIHIKYLQRDSIKICLEVFGGVGRGETFQQNASIQLTDELSTEKWLIFRMDDGFPSIL